MDVSFFDLGIDPAIVRALAEQGIEEPFEVQREAIPDIMLGNDICCRAPTGSGKTLAFGLPLISRTPRADPEFPTSLILSPTRELAEQICKVLTPLAATFDLEVLAIYGGTPYGRQRKALSRGVDIVVACPGRLLDLINHGALSLEDVGAVVLDEADRMADMGFMEPVCEILDLCAQNRQTILFSATLDDEVGDLVENYLHKPAIVEVGPKEVSMDSMEHFFWVMKNSMKLGIASEIIRKCGRTVVFCRTRRGVDRIGDELVEDGIGVAILHGGLDQKKRDRAMAKFAEGRCMALIATDVAARGIDVEGINCVIHYDPPENGKAYKHRSGRTARAGAKGTVVSLVQSPQKKACSNIQKDVGIFVKFTPPDFNQLPKYDVEYIPPSRRDKPRKPKRDARRAHFHRRGDRNQKGRGNPSGGRRSRNNSRQEGHKPKRGANPRGGRPTGKRRHSRNKRRKQN
ncbi:MAG: RNA helicase [Euryarchaeota archaeon]|nr:RNA helicase [Euryarchaeota archaeon]MEC7704833.1 DEAD/DEAH box helicase [Candidatus Thermoplasmatota archaeon]